jgi:hypothetical protein
MATDVLAITQARSMLIILIATCQQTLLAVDDVNIPLESDLADDLRRLIARSENALEALNQKLHAS